MRLTLSKLGLAQRCRWWLRPDVQPAPQPSSVHAQKGTALHALVEEDAAKADAVLAALSESDRAEVMAWEAAWLASEWSAFDWQHETALAFDVETGKARMLATEGRDYSSCTPTEIPGTVDLWRIDGETLIVADLKTGRQSGLDPAGANAQLRGYSLALCRILGLESARVVILHVDEEGVRADAADLDVFDLLAIETEFRALNRPSEAAPGMHCHERWCPAVAECPATTRAIQLAEPGEPFQLQIASPEHAARGLVRLRLVQAACEQFEARLRAFATESGGIPLDDGRRWGPVPVNKSRIDLDGPGGPEGLAILGRADVQVERRHSITKVEIERAAGGKKAAKELLSELRAAGCVQEWTETHFKATGRRSEG